MLNVNNLKNRGNNLSLDLAVRNIIRRQSQAFNGVWYDPSDLSTMFQDSAGTVPVTGPGQPVGLILDKSKGGWGSNLTTNSDFSSGLAGWEAYGYTASSGGAKADGVTGAPFLRQSLPLSEGKTYHVAFTVSGRTGGNCYLVLGGTQPAGAPNLVNGTYSFFVVTAASNNYLFFATPSGTFDGVIDNVSVREISGNHATQSTTGYKPLYQKSGNLSYLEFDGLDDFLVTGNIDFSVSDKITVAAGVLRGSDNAAVLVEFGANQNTTSNSWYLSAPESTTVSRYASSARGTAATSEAHLALVNNTPAAPDLAVVSALHDIAGDLSRIRRNGVFYTPGTADKGSGNFGNYPLYIGRRGGTSLPFKGNLYGLFIGGGLDDIYKLKKVEQYLAAKTGVII